MPSFMPGTPPMPFAPDAPVVIVADITLAGVGSIAEVPDQAMPTEIPPAPWQ